jgi:precorrin-3B synthase
MPLGALKSRGTTFAVGLASPFGRVEAPALRGLADAIADAGGGEVRLSPWRALYIPILGEGRAAALLDATAKLGFLTDPADAVLRIDACPGAPACRSAMLDTRATARTLAHLMPRLRGVRTVHVSGCAKGCARSAAADLVLVAAQDRYAIVRNGRADDNPAGHVDTFDVERLPAILSRLPGKCHA